MKTLTTFALLSMGNKRINTFFLLQEGFQAEDSSNPLLKFAVHLKEDRTMKKLTITCLALVAMVASSQTTKAAPVSLTLNLTTDTNLNLFVTIFGGGRSANVPFNLIGSIDITLDDAIGNLAGTNDTASISLDDAAIDFSDESVSDFLDEAVFSHGPIGFTGLGINSLSSNGGIALTTTSPTDPYAYTFDPGGGSPTALSIDEGAFSYMFSGPIGSLIGSGTIDFAMDPVGVTVSPVGQIGLVTQDVTVTGDTIVVDVVVSAPLDFAFDILITPGLSTVEPDGVFPFDLEFSGALVATGSYTTIIPEPSTLVLLGIAIAGMIPLWRRLRG